MPNYRITDLPNYTNPDPANDVIEIVNVGSNTSQKITRNNLLGLTSAPVGLNDTQTITNKTLTAPAINSPVLGGTITGTYTFAGTPTFPATIVTTTGTQTLSNKTLTSPIITAPTITNASLTADAISGFTTANTGTIYGVPVTGGTLGAGALATNAVQANQLSASAITLGYAQIVADFTSTTAGSYTDVTGLTTTVTIPSGSRRIEIGVGGNYMTSTTAATFVELSAFDVTASVQVGETGYTVPTASYGGNPYFFATHTPSSGSRTYKVQFKTNAAGTFKLAASATIPAFILVKAI